MTAKKAILMSTAMTAKKAILMKKCIRDSYWAKSDMAVAQQKLHPHGHGWSIVNNVDQWSWK